MTTTAAALIPEFEANLAQCKEARMLIIFKSDQFPVEVFKSLAQHHNATAHSNPHTGEAAISMPYRFNRAISALNMLHNAGIKVERDKMPYNLIAARMQPFEAFDITAAGTKSQTVATTVV